MRQSLPRRLVGVAVTLVVALHSPGLPAAGAGIAVTGTVLDAGTGAPRPDAVVALLDPTGRVVSRAEPADADGSFRVPSVPPGIYAAAVESRDGRFVGAPAVEVGTATPPPLTLALAPAQASGKKGLSTGAKWGIAGAVIVVGTYLVFGLRDDEPVSPFEPGN